MPLQREVIRALQSIVGPEYVSEDPVVCHTYSKGGYGKDIVVGRGNLKPACVVLPGNTDEVQRIVKLANRYKVPFVPVGTFWFYACGPYRENVLSIDLKRMNKIEIDERNMYAVCEPYVIFSQLYATSKDRLNLLADTAPSFFRVVQRVLLDDILLSLSRLTDRPEIGGQRNLCIRRLADAVQGLGDPPFFASVLSQVEDIEASCRPFRVARNKRIAHTDLPTVFDRAGQPLPPVTRETIEKALSLLRGLLNFVVGHFESVETAYEYVQLIGDGDTIAHHLKRSQELEELEKQMRREVLTSRSAGA